MNRLEEYGAERIELAAEMRKLIELDAMTEVQSKEFDRLQGEVRAVDKQIERIKAVEETEARNAEITTRAKKPSGSPAVVKNRGDNESERMDRVSALWRPGRPESYWWRRAKVATSRRSC